MTSNTMPSSLPEFGFRSASGLIWTMAIFSFFVNLLMLVSPIFMLQIYDRVLPSRSVPTLLALSGLVAVLFILAGILDYARGRIAAKLGYVIHHRLDGPAFSASLRSAMVPRQRTVSASGLKDIEAIQRLMGSPVLFAVFDMPWTPIFIFVCYRFHPWLGNLAVVGALILVGLTVLNQLLTRQHEREAAKAAAASDSFAETIRQLSEEIRALGMRKASLARWQKLRTAAHDAQYIAGSRTSALAHISKYFRYALQSAVLAVGAYWVIYGEMTAGEMIAASILLGRALAPIDQAIGGWPLVQRALRGRASLLKLFEVAPEPAPQTALPRPQATLTLENLIYVPEGHDKPILRLQGLKLEPGQALGVIGPSAAGKSTLAKLIAHVWEPTQGYIRLDGAEYSQYDSDVLGRYIGYVPQDVELIDGTIAQNIARLDPQVSGERIVAAAKKAGAHEMILSFPRGYDTQVLSRGARLSGGQKQRIGLARAFCGDPVLLVLDEPNSNLDRKGQEALDGAIESAKQDGMAVIIITHRPAGIEKCDYLLALNNGEKEALGPRDQVLKDRVRNHAQVVPLRPDQP